MAALTAETELAGGVGAFNAEKPPAVVGNCGVNSEGKFGRADVAQFRSFDKYLPVTTCPRSQWEMSWRRKKLVLHNLGAEEGSSPESQGWENCKVASFPVL